MGMKRTETKPEVGRPEAFMAAEDVDLGDRPLASTQVQSPGIRRIEAITKAWNKTDKIWFIIGILLLTYTRRLGANILNTYGAIALNEFKETGSSGMVRTVRQVLTSATLPVTAKMTDYFGRSFMLSATIVFWIVGPIVFATSTGLGGYISGFLLYTMGHVAGNILNYALSIDTTSLRNRLFLLFIGLYPGIINVWAGGVIADKVVEGPGWRWGSGMFAILVPVFSVSLVAVMLYGTLKARRRGYMKGIPSSWSLLRSRRSWVHLFWTMDIIGLVFLCGALGCILLPLALGGGVAAKWRTPQTLVPLVIGILCLPAFVIWERYGAPQPIFPSWAMKDRTVVVVLLIQFFLAIGGSTREAYLYYALVVSFNQGTEGATRINNLEGFTQVVTILVAAFFLRKFRVVKPFVVAGTILIIVAQGMFIHYRGGYSRTDLAGLIAGEVLDGIGGGLVGQPALVGLQSRLGHEQALLISSCFGVGAQAGGGIAAAIAGAVWTQNMPGKLRRGLEAAGIPNATAIARDVYRQPLTFVKTNPPGSPAREAVTNAYRDVQRLLAIIGICISAVALPLALFMENITLTDERSLVERDDVSETSSVEREKEKGDAVEVDPGYVQDNKARPVV